MEMESCERCDRGEGLIGGGEVGAFDKAEMADQRGNL
jgi:hypothetical protein